MNQSAILKKKGPNPNKAQSPFKNLDVDMQYRSSAELANKFKIKREQLANERNDRAKKEQAPIPHKRKNSEDFIPQHGKRKGQTKQRLFQSGESIQEKGIKLPMNNSRFQTSFKKGVTASVHVTGTTLGNGEVQHDNEDLLNFKQVKRKSVRPTTTIDLFLDKQQIHNEHDIHDPIINEHNKGLDDLVDQEELGGDECDVEEEIDIDCSTKVKGKKWVMTGLRDAWRQHKQKIKENFFDKNSTLEDMLAKRPDGSPDNQFRQLIEYWKHPTVQAICEMNSQNRKKQKWRHRMGPINFARVRMALRAAKDNNEEPSKPEMFIATRIKTGKEIQADTQVAIAELQNRQNSRETADDAFRAVFGKEKAGRLRCYGRSVTTSSLKKDEEINNLKQKHANEITSLKEELRHLFTQLLQNNPGLNFQDMSGCVGSNLASPIDASSAQAVRGTNLPHSSRSAHDSVLQTLYECCIVLKEYSTDFGL
ncbi:hypothetical protein KY284_001346 [Solanum tuberosum]|nr:hypothetical protein KY284_001346 [Solanum tuberosum]